MSYADSMMIGRIGRAGLVTGIWAAIWTIAGLAVAGANWLVSSLNVGEAAADLPFSVFMALYPGLGLFTGLWCGVLFALLLIVVRKGGRQQIARISLLATVGATALGVVLAAPVIDSTVLSYVSAVFMVAVIAAAGRVSAGLSTPLLLEKVGT